jgi:hypothetical protein
MSLMSKLNPKGEQSNKGGEYAFEVATPKVAPSTIPSVADHKSSMIDGPYGGKKPA